MDRKCLEALVALAILAPGATVAQCLEFGTQAFCYAKDTTISSLREHDFTVEAVIKGEQSDQFQHPPILSNRNGPTGFMFFIHGLWGGSNYPMLAVQLSGVNYFLLNNGTFNGPILDGTCHHVAITRGRDTLNFFIDGTSIGSMPIWGPHSALSTANFELIGADFEDWSTFRGMISYVRAWDRALTPEEVLSWGGTDIPGDAPGLRGYWKLTEGAGQYSVDQTGQKDMRLGWSDMNTTGDPIWTNTCCKESELAPMTRNPAARELRFDAVADRLIIGPDPLGVPARACVFDHLGRVVHGPYEVSSTGGAWACSGLTTGLYVAVMEDGRHRETLRFFVQR
jgi:hypothetical protein